MATYSPGIDVPGSQNASSWAVGGKADPICGCRSGRRRNAQATCAVESIRVAMYRWRVSPGPPNTRPLALARRNAAGRSTAQKAARFGADNRLPLAQAVATLLPVGITVADYRPPMIADGSVDNQRALPHRRKRTLKSVFQSLRVPTSCGD